MTAIEFRDVGRLLRYNDRPAPCRPSSVQQELRDVTRHVEALVA